MKVLLGDIFACLHVSFVLDEPFHLPILKIVLKHLLSRLSVVFPPFGKNRLRFDENPLDLIFTQLLSERWNNLFSGFYLPPLVEVLISAIPDEEVLFSRWQNQRDYEGVIHVLKAQVLFVDYFNLTVVQLRKNKVPPLLKSCLVPLRVKALDYLFFD